MYKRTLPSQLVPNFPSPQVLLLAAVFIKTHSAEVSRLCGKITLWFPLRSHHRIVGKGGGGRGGGGTGPGFSFLLFFFLFLPEEDAKDAPTQVSPRLCIAHPASGCMNITMPACRVLNQPPAKCQMPVQYVDELIRIGRLGGFRKLSVRWRKRNDI